MRTLFNAKWNNRQQYKTQTGQYRHRRTYWLILPCHKTNVEYSEFKMFYQQWPSPRTVSGLHSMSSICTFFRHTCAVFCNVSQSAVPLPKGFGLALYLEDTWLESRPGQYHDHTSAASCQTLTIHHSRVIKSFGTTQPVLPPPPLKELSCLRLHQSY